MSMIQNVVSMIQNVVSVIQNVVSIDAIMINLPWVDNKRKLIRVEHFNNYGGKGHVDKSTL